MTRVLVTGAGGAAAITVADSLRAQDVTLYMADVDPRARGFSLVPHERRVGLPRQGGSVLAEVVLQACIDHKIDIVIPTRDDELLPLARRRARFREVGTTLMLPATASLESALDRWSLLRLCDGVVYRPRTELFGTNVDLTDWTYPLVVKPRFRADPRPSVIVDSYEEACELRRDNALLVQEYLPGGLVEVDVLASPLGAVVASVPRGVHGASSRDLRGAEPIAAAERVVHALRGSYACTVQFRRDRNGRLALLGVVPRITPGMRTSRAAGDSLLSLGLQFAQREISPANKPLYPDFTGWAHAQ